MRTFVRSSVISLALLVLFASLPVMTGCASSSRLRMPENDNDLATEVLHRYLDRWVGWRSLTADVRITVSSPDTSVSARGHLIYLLGERFEIGFVKPYNRVLGNFYVTPDQLIYWDVNSSPHVYAARDSIRLPDLLDFPVPDWDPRDMLPFAVSGRTGGFQPDSVQSEGDVLVLSGVSDGVAHELHVAKASGLIESEWVSRAGRDPMLKKFGKTRLIRDWPVPVRVTCTDESGEFAIEWSLGGIDFDAEP